MYLSKAQILGANDATYTEIDVPEWGGIARIATITAAERGSYDSSLFKFGPDGSRTINQKNLETLRIRLISACLVDEKGERLFTPKDIEQLGHKNAAVIERVFKVCQDHNGMEPEKKGDARKGEAQDDFEGN